MTAADRIQHPSGARPLQPTIVKQIAVNLATLDPRCDFEAHNRIIHGEQCPYCKLDLFTYAEWVRLGLKAWPL